MPRRALLITLIVLFSLGLFSVRPAFSETAKAAPPAASEVAALKEEVAELRKELAEERTAREKFGFKMEILKEKLEGWYLNTKTIGEWIDKYIVMVLTAVAVFAGGLGLVIRLFFRVEVQRVQALGDDMRRIRDEAGELMQGLHDSVAEASAITEELEQRRVQIDEGIKKREKEAVEAIDEKRDQAAEFNQFFMEGFREFEQGNYKASLKAYEQALAIDEESATAWTSKGGALLNLGRHEESLEASEKAIGFDPELALAWTNKGGALGNLGRHDESLGASEKAIELDPNYASAFYNKGVTLGELGRYEDELEAYEKAIELDPNYALAWYNKACAHSQLGQKAELLDSLKKAIELSPNNKEMAKIDDDFEPYRDDPDFRDLVFGEEREPQAD